MSNHISTYLFNYYDCKHIFLGHFIVECYNVYTRVFLDGKLWPKGSRRREPTGGSLASKCEPVRNKPSSQRTNNKTFDKRPRSRNYPTQQLPSIVDRAETTGLDEPQSAELGSVILSGSKKQNLNHLLNFSYSSPRSETNSRYGADGLIGNRSSSNRLLMARKYKYSKEHFLQAKYEN